MGSRLTSHVLAAVLLLAVLLVPAGRVVAAGPAGVLVTPFTDSGLDTDGDGLYDFHVIDVTVEVTSPGWFDVRSDMGYPVDVHAYLDVGPHILRARTYGFSLYERGFTGSYQATVSLMDWFNGSVLDSVAYTTGFYRWTDFVPPAAMIESIGTPWPMDTNANGLYDELRLNYTLNVTGHGVFSVVEDIRQTVDPWASQLTWNGTPEVGVGVHELTFAFPGGLINRSGYISPLHLYLQVMQWFREPGYTLGTSVSLRDAYAPYDWDAFEPVSVRMVPPFSDHGVDLDRDGVPEEIVVHVPLHLEQPSLVTLRGYLGPSLALLSYAQTSESLPVGDLGMDLHFPAFKMRASNASGPYPVNISLSASVLQGNGEWRSYTTGAYSFAPVIPASASLGPPEFTWADPDHDQKLDFLDVRVPVAAAQTGDYLVQGYLYTAAPGTPPLEAGRFVHIAAGSSSDVTLRYSGVALNRSASEGLWDLTLSATPLGGVPGDRAWTWTTTPRLPRDWFVGRDHAELQGTLRSADTGFPLANETILAVDASRYFWAAATTSAAGAFSFDLYNGTFALAAVSTDPSEGQPLARAVTLSGSTAADLELPSVPLSRSSWDAAFSAWNASAVTWTQTRAYANETIRIEADVYGNFDGFANASELAWWIRYPFSLPFAAPAPSSELATLGLTADGRALTPGPESLTILRGTGGYDSAEAIVASAAMTFRDNASPSAGSNHHIGVRIAYDQFGLDRNLTLHLPARTLSRAATSDNISLYHTNLTTWILDPLRPRTPSTLDATASVDTAPDLPPIAAFTAGTAERGVPIALDGSASTDDVGIVNETWRVTVNGTVHTAYGAQVTWTFSEIGAYTVTLTAKDAAGNEGSVSHAILVRDTRAPPTATGLATVPWERSGGIGIDVSWSAVDADDLVGYRIYRSTDNGSTFAVLGQVSPGVTTYADTAITAGATYVYRVTALDRYGNEAAPSVTVTGTAPVPSTVGPGPSDLWIGLGAVAVGAAIVAIFLVLRRRGHRPPPPESPTP